MDRCVYLGPFAEVLVPAKAINDAFNRLPIWEEMREGETLFNNWGRDLPPAVTLDGVRYHRFCFFPLARRAGEPPREFKANDILGIEDLRGVNAKAEIDWFATAFGEELARLAEQLQRPVNLRWGIVGWHS